MGEEIGSGTYGHVYRAQEKSQGTIFAVKVGRIDERDEHDRKYCENLQRELEICGDLRHRHIVSCLGHAYINQRLFIYLEYVSGGSLRHHLREFGPLEGPLLQKAARGVLKGLRYLHEHEPPVVHRDLKCANILVDQQFCVKVADFGCSKRDSFTQSFSQVGSALWSAPEVFHQEGGHGRKADIWSFGCVMAEMATAVEPWGRGAFDNIMHAIQVVGFSKRTPPVPEELSDAGRDMCRRCLTRAPDSRPSASQLLEHEFVRALPSRASSRQPVRPPGGEGAPSL